jgi:ACS family tartrate transporter-like MFS transporter
VAIASSRAIAPAAAQFADRTRHHIALWLLPFLFVLYVINYLDRTSVAYAAIGMSRGLGFSDRVVGMGVGVFFISCVALQIPGAVLVERWSARNMISATMIAWGSMTALTIVVGAIARGVRGRNCSQCTVRLSKAARAAYACGHDCGH